MGIALLVSSFRFLVRAIKGTGEAARTLLNTFFACNQPASISIMFEIPCASARDLGTYSRPTGPGLRLRLRIPVRLCRLPHPVHVFLEEHFETNVLYRDSLDLMLLLQSTSTAAVCSSHLVRQTHQPHGRQSC